MELPGSARDRRHEQNFIPFLEGVTGPAQEADVFLIHVNVEEAAHLSSLIAQVRLQVRKFFIEDGKQLSHVRSRARDRAYSRSVPTQCSRDLYDDRHLMPPSYAPTVAASSFATSATSNVCFR